MLELDGVSASYGGLAALRNVSLSVAEREVVAILGANGAGKSTLLNTIAGLHKPDRGRILYQGRELQALPAHEVARVGVALVPEGRRLFPRLSVRDNLRLGSLVHRKAKDREQPLEFVFSLFPLLAERLSQRAETLSGGEQQMLSIGRALMLRPRILMLDEPSQGLMPRLVDAILESVGRIRDHGTAVLIVEQRVAESLAAADRAYVLQSGRVVLSGTSKEVAENPGVRAAYLGL